MCLNYNSCHVSYETACDILLCIFRISILVEPCAAFECIFMPLQGLGSRTAFKNSFLLAPCALKILYWLIIYIDDSCKFKFNVYF